MVSHTDTEPDTIGISINQGHITVNGDRIILQVLEVSKNVFTGCVSVVKGSTTRFVISNELVGEELKETVDKLETVYSTIKSNQNLLTVKELQVSLPARKIEEDELVQYIIESIRRDFIQSHMM
jgi:hypothetical protein